MGDGCLSCKKWEKHHYWNSMAVEKIHFFKVMAGNFSQRLSVPKKFAKLFRGDIGETVKLKGPSGKKWRVRAAKTPKGMFLTAGWSDFAKDHSLMERDFLVFKYAGNSSFDVLMFDWTCCEKESSYFVKDPASVCGATWVDDDMQGMHVSDSDDDDHVNKEEALPPLVTPRPSLKRKLPELDSDDDDDDDDDDNNKEEALPPLVTPGPSLKRKEPSSTQSPATRPRRGRPPHRLMNTQGGDNHIDQGSLDAHDEKINSLTGIMISNRRRLTGAESEKTKELVRSIQPRNPFFVTMLKPTHVKICLILPHEFVEQYLPSENPYILLQTPQKKLKWSVITASKRRATVLSGNWVAFVLDNNLKVGDICLFELISRRKEVVMMVHVSRVVE